MKTYTTTITLLSILLFFSVSNAQTPNFSLTSISAPTPIIQYDCYSVTATMHNNGPSGTYDFECDLNSSSGSTWYRFIEKKCSNYIASGGNITLTFSTSSSSSTSNHSSITQSSGNYSIQIVALYSSCFSCGNTGCSAQNVGSKTAVTVQATSCSGYCMSNSSVTTCSGTFYDSGGDDKYGNNQNYVKTFTPSTSGSKVKMTFSSFSVENNWDYLYIYDGPSTSSTLIGTYTGSNSPGTVTATNTSGQLTFKFTSDGSNNCSTGNWYGWEASISCVSGCNSVTLGTQPQSQTKSVGTSATFSVSAANGTSPFSYQWYKNSSPISGAINSSYTTASLTMGDNGNTYYCIVTNCAGSYSATSNTATLTVTSGGGSPPVADFTSNVTSISAGQSISYTDLSTNAPTAWDWTFAGGTPNTSSAQNPTISYSAPGTYSVSLKSYNSNGWGNTQYKGGYVTVTAASGASIGLSGSLSFGDVTVGNSSQRSFTISNAGNVALNVSSITFPSGFTGDWSGGTIAVGNIRNVLVTFTPTSATTYGGAITVNSNATSGTNTTSCSGTGTPVPQASNITVNNVIPGIYTFQTKEFWRGTTSDIAKTIKICADASKATEIIFVNKTGVATNNIRFWVASDWYGNNSAASGYFIQGDYSYNVNTIKAKYSHPKYLEEGHLPFRPDSFLIVDYTTQTIIFSIPIQIYRAPVLMIHGLWGNSTSFDDMENDLFDAGMYPSYKGYSSKLSPLLLKVDYKRTNSESFSDNALVIPTNITTILEEARSNFYSTAKVDIVAHSMGGILARGYIQSSLFTGRQDIHKLITLNTPHSGSQAANLLLNYTSCIGIMSNALVTEVVMYGMGNFGKTASDPAVGDLRVNSQAIHDLNITNLNRGIVPSHSVVTEGTVSFVKDAVVGAILNATIFCAIGSTNTFLNHLFYDQPHDVIVAVSSQEGGLPSSAISHYNGQSHMEVEHNPLVIQEVIDALGINSANQNYFAQTGYSPINLSLQTHYKKNNADIDTFKLYQGNLSIDYPNAGQSYHPGDTISIEVSSTAGINKMLFQVSSSASVFYQDTALSNGIMEYIVPSDAFGKVGIFVLGKDSLGGRIDYDKIVINVDINATLDSIVPYPSEIYVSKNNYAPFSVKGYFSNGRSYDITNSKGVGIFVSDTFIAKSELPYGILGKLEGINTATITYKGKSAQMSIKVFPEDTTLTGIATSAQTLNSPTEFASQVYPNPNSGYFTLQLNTNYKCKFTISVVDVLGAIIYTEDWDVSNSDNLKTIGLKNVASGMYTVFIQNSEGINHHKVLIQR